ncbi:MAG: type II toxin-antitoxin system RelE/ParE family toxin [Rhodospirillaceae bacterium]|nr:type II toxin-antitoxin system RelE/ParE family toxin [Rhodospirillales bacterium]
MPARLDLTRAASRDLAAVRTWYSQTGSGQRAKDTVLRILQVIADLAEHPDLWQEIEGGVQKAIVADHVIHYRANYTQPDRTGATVVTVLRIWRPRNNVA